MTGAQPDSRFEPVADPGPFSRAIQAQIVPQRKFGLSDLFIATKDKRLIRFAPNPVQARYLDIILPGWRDGAITIRGLREILLKARQFGFSTLVAGLFFADTISTPHTNTVVVSYDVKSAERLFLMVSRMYLNLPEADRPRTQRANTRELVWPDLDSSYNVLTAGSGEAGRAWTINNLHASEGAFWRDRDALTSMINSVPDEGNIFLESTANGEGAEEIDDEGERIIEGSAFHVYYLDGKRDDNLFRSRFFAWFEHPEYRTRPRAVDFRPLTEESEKTSPIMYRRYGDEAYLMGRYDLSLAQLQWRRDKIDAPGMSPSKFCQEYPSNDIEAFRSTGRSFFRGLWEPDRHIGDVDVLPWWPILGAQDWGFESPYCALLAYVMDNGGIYISDECYGARKINKQQGEEILAMLALRGVLTANIQTWASDPAMWAKKGAQFDGIGKADVESFWEIGLPCIPADNARIAGWSNLREYLRLPGMLKVSPRCTNLIRYLPMLVGDPHKPEDVLKCDIDHAADTLRYLLNTRPIAGQMPAEAIGMFVEGRPDPERPLEYRRYPADDFDADYYDQGEYPA